MAVYVSNDEGRYLSKEDGSPCPATIEVTPNKLQVGDILILQDWSTSPYTKRSVSVTIVEADPKHDRKMWITVVDGVGKVEKLQGWKGSKQFHRQCSQEVVDEAYERSENIVLRRILEKLRKQIDETHDNLKRRKNGYKIYTGEMLPGMKNPKVDSYLAIISKMEQDCKTMYEEVGRDLGLKPKKK